MLNPVKISALYTLNTEVVFVFLPQNCPVLHFFKKYRIFILTMFVFAILFLSVSYQLLNPKKTLPIMNPSDVNPELVDSTIQYVSKYHTIADFSFTNQNGKTITQKDYAGKIYVADFFFTTCQTICPIMTDNMVEIQKAVLHNPKVMLLSHSVMPNIDDVPALKAYAIKKGVVDSKWNLVTGDKKAIYGIARKSYLAVKTANSSELYDMVHTENFVLIDTKRRIRGFYDGTKKEDIQRLIADIGFLSSEEE
jgi:protein SCO1/2